MLVKKVIKGSKNKYLSILLVKFYYTYYFPRRDYIKHFAELFFSAPTPRTRRPLPQFPFADKEKSLKTFYGSQAHLSPPAFTDSWNPRTSPR